ncbi:MAG: YicC/YloC family endoribonuclease [Pseudomonadales bacterium]
MISSMTAFARAEAEGMAWELRSVNQRYLEVNFKLPEAARSIEIKLRENAREQLYRGKVDCVLRLDSAEPKTASLEVDDDVVLALHRAIDHISTLTGSSSSTSPIEMLRWPGVLRQQETLDDDLLEKVTSLFDEALASLTQMREREGEKLKGFIEARLNEVEAIVNAVREEVPAINKRLEARLRERLNSIDTGTDTDQGRLEQELIYFAQKSDIQEELDRLESHMAAVRHCLDESGATGRRLDFLMQELNREASTLSSKAVAANTSLQAVDLKVLIEQMREQIQNIE